MDETSSSSLKIPSRIVLRSNSTVPSLSERFAKLRPIALPNEQQKMAGPRDPRNFLYDDYYEDQHDVPEEYSPPRSAAARQPARRQRNNVDMELDDYSQRRGGTAGVLGRRRGYESSRDFEAPSGDARPHARRFANAMGIAAPRVSHDYDDLDFGLPPRARAQRVLYRAPPPVARVSPVRRQVIRRRVVDEDDYDDVDLPAGRGEVVEVVERVRRVPQRRVQIVKKIPIHQRVVKKIIVQKVQRPSFAPKRRQSNENQGRIGRVQNRGGGVQKKKLGGGGGPGPSKGGRFNKKEQKPKLSASDLDRELDEYMRGNKHPRINT